ncbi:5-methylcytosine restriction system specificity protein McrC [Sphingobacterium siyangense]|uniref:5-methylcytosine restriction system specificity protein McrC n=1 Tax=Sphingobacterium siyangense TaxID=459529 RepID=UPI002FDEC321
MGIRLSEHKSYWIRLAETEEDVKSSLEGLTVLSSDFISYDSVISKRFNNNSHRFLFEKKERYYELKADYCIGVDWLGLTNRSIYVEPKINNSNVGSFISALEDKEGENAEQNSEDSVFELNYLKMLLEITSTSESNSELEALVQIDWDSKQIPIEQKDDKLTPFLIVRFLQILKLIVRKGLKKGYYKVQENLNNRIKGKVLVGQHIKQNILKNKLTSTYCEYQVFDIDHTENRFLKKVLDFVVSYVESHKLLLKENLQNIQETIYYCRPSFELVSNIIKESELKNIKHNPFYKDYRDALKVGSYILRRFAYNITKTSDRKVYTPPFWIDMPRLFEMYVYSKMIEHNSKWKKEIHFQFSTYGNALDILVSHPDYQMVIDAKYKLKYQTGHLHQDIRQVAGYARLNRVREKLKLKVDEDRNINCLIIYPDIINGEVDLSLKNIYEAKQPIEAYYNIYKIGVKLPFIN